MGVLDIMYKYITADNLEDKQNYMYSKYGGNNFLNEYLLSREIPAYIERKLVNGVASVGSVKKNIEHLNERLANYSATERDFELLDVYLKSFEVRKRLYCEYDDNMKPVAGSDYRDYDLYLMMASCLVKAYRVRSNLRYVNCLLKIDDTLLSLCKNFSKKQYDELVSIISTEIAIVKQVALKNNVGIGVDKK